ncbi:hypothetical protein [Sphingomonas sp. TDK1]|uniref:hypothetical protein n=1 Tax=Sphingomonas sp. TDK1 TaxID=453247 RepID=UPI0007D8E600|nr:hypothetical protein [Sphingomonas sp. TDK1]OAN62319.1 hypothetical protein A7X12_22825 [Sphingomonas sp. TDK1]
MSAAAAAAAPVASRRHAILLIVTAVMPTMGIVALVPVLPLLLREFAAVPSSAVLVRVALTIPALCIALPFLLKDLPAIIVARAVMGCAEAAILTISTAVLACIGSGLMQPNMLAWLMRRLPAAARGSGTGTRTGAFFLGRFAAPLITTLLMPATGGLSQTLLLYTALALAGAVAALLASGRVPDPIPA